MPKKVAKMCNWRLHCNRRSPRISAMEERKSTAVQDHRISYGDRKRQKLKRVHDTAAKRIKQVESSADLSSQPATKNQSVKLGTTNRAQKETLMNIVQAMLLTSVPSMSPIPDKRILEFILDILQRRDTREIFAEPVDPNEVEGYYDIIKEPMDFGTMRAKLHEGMYSSLEQFESDVFLISKNAMQFNSSATIYFRQARAIHELAKRVFNSLKTDPEGFGSRISQTRRRNSRRIQSEAAVSVSSPGSKLPVNPQLSRASVGGSTRKSPGNRKGGRAYESFSGDRYGESRDSSCTELERRSTYRHGTSFSNEDNAAASKLMPVDLTNVSYKESLMLFTRSLGPTARRIAAHKLQIAAAFIQTANTASYKTAASGDAPTFCSFRGEALCHSGSYSSSGFTIPNFSGIHGSAKAASTSTRGTNEDSIVHPVTIPQFHL